MAPYRLLLLWPPLLLLATAAEVPTQKKSLDVAPSLLWKVETTNSTDAEEGSGQEEGSGEGSGQHTFVSNFIVSADAPAAIAASRDGQAEQVPVDVSFGSSRSRFMASVIDKRAADKTAHKLGSVPTELLQAVTVTTLSAPPSDAYRGLGRTLKKGSAKPRDEYIAFIPRATPLWGKLYRDDAGMIQADFVDNDKLLNARVASPNIRVLRLPTNAADVYNLGYDWVLARDVDPLAIIVQVFDTRKYYRKVTAGVYSDGGYEVLGEADVENRIFRYVGPDGQVHRVESSLFDAKVFVLVKRSCSCSCPSSSSGGILSSIKDFFG